MKFGVFVLLCIIDLFETELTAAISLEDGRLAVMANFLKENQKELRGVSNDEFLNDVLLSTINTSTIYLSDSSASDLSFLSDDVEIAECASGWTRYAETGNCYRIYNTLYNWYDSEEYCWNQRAGAHLVSIHSQSEAQWLNAQFRNAKKKHLDAWIGLRRDCDNVTYIWTDQSPGDFLWWQPDYPGSGFAEISCATIWEQVSLHSEPGYVPGQFDDMRDCSSEGENGSNALCKYDPNTSIIGEKYVKKKCGLIPESTKSTTTTSTTTTATSTTTETTTQPTTTPTTTTQTSTTSTPTTTTVPTSVQTTTAMKILKNVLGECSASCGSYYFNYRGGCYGIVQGTSNYATAKLGCNAFGGEMAVIEDANMNEAFRLAFNSNNDSTIANQAWIGVSSYTNFALGKPNQAQGANYTSYCNVMALSVVNSGDELGFSRGVWTDYPCSLTQEYAICKQK